MKTAISVYRTVQEVSLEGEQAFAELYGRLARWCAEIAEADRAGDPVRREKIVDKAINLLSLMDSMIDGSRSPEIAARIMALHRFAIRKLVETKSRETANGLVGLDSMLLATAEIFEAMRASGRRRAFGR
jgi:flagellin-specific chaperone FliS